MPQPARPVSRTTVLAFVIMCAAPGLITAFDKWSGFPGSFLTANHATVIQDYIVMWTAGRLALAGNLSALADWHPFNAAIGHLLGSGIDAYYWLYPPHILLIATPLAVLPPLASFAAWTMLTYGMLWLVLRGTGYPMAVRLAVMLSPAAIENMIGGQNGAVIAAAIIGGLSFADRRPWLAGLLLSLLTLKPQFALVAPVCLLASRNWRTIGTSALLSAAWLGASVAAFGIAPWNDYFTSIIPEARMVHISLDTLRFGALYLHYLVITPFATLRSLGMPSAPAGWVQAAISLAVLALVWRAWSPRGKLAPGLRLAFALLAMPLATPYAMAYDAVAATLGCVLLFRENPRPNPWIYPIALAYAWPGISLYFGTAVRPGMGSLAFAMAAAAAWRLQSSPAEPAASVPAPDCAA